VSLFADSIDFLEDASVNLLIVAALGMTLAWRARVGICCIRPPNHRSPSEPPPTTKVLPARNSFFRVLWNRSPFPVVVGDRGAVNKCWIPFSRQTRSNNTSPLPGPNAYNHHDDVASAAGRPAGD